MRESLFGGEVDQGGYIEKGPPSLVYGIFVVIPL
jgi:hypothetical protein